MEGNRPSQRRLGDLGQGQASLRRWHLDKILEGMKDCAMHKSGGRALQAERKLVQRLCHRNRQRTFEGLEENQCSPSGVSKGANRSKEGLLGE